ncbi:MAG: Anthranilate synthase, aminase component [uncultured Thermomicrobiales bacterium]|uniref:Anthranilate synthase component 1 n=1 Tax=uncultured Thermomicrobiales bacterium TaxID=1645740 RepID=A0A6J4URD7_9BACT|nr:MAG: Anthranilate synthase, aminase component [uncultured Thermomicrobiales bacterium]
MTVTVERRGAARGSSELTPSLDAVETLVRERGVNCIPIFREVLADLETPVSAYLKVVGHERQGFLLESVEGGERVARYSFIGADPLCTLRLHDGTLRRTEADGAIVERPFADPLAALDEELARYRTVAAPGLPRFSGGAVGYLGYEAIRYFERLAVPERDALGLPDGVFLLADALLVFDHVRRRVKVVAHVLPESTGGDVAAAYARAEAKIAELLRRLRAPLTPAPIANRHPEYFDAAPVHNTTQAEYEAKVRRAQEYIAAGDIFQVVLSQRLDRPTAADPFTIYRALRAVNPSPYMYFLQFGDFQIVGASPELLVRLEDGIVTNHPIAGTYPRGADEVEDAALAARLLADEKERAEHIMLVDLGRNDVGRVAVPGTVRVPKLLTVERYSHVMHLVSNVEGELRPELRGVDALRACFPAGTVSGAPKIRAMEIIAELERDRRGPYSGAVGYVGFDGALDTAITLRTMVVKDGIVSLQAGGGIVADSDPAREYAECFHKLGGSLRAVDLAEEMVNDES